MATDNDVDIAGSVGKALLDVPIGDMISSIGIGIASAQNALDMNSLRTAQMLTGEYEDDDNTKQSSLVTFDGEKLSLMELGFTPTFYQFVETIIEIKISVSMSQTRTSSKSSTDVSTKAELQYSFWKASVNATLNVSTVSASFSSKFQYNAEGSSLIRTKLVPVPAPAVLEARIRQSLDRKAAARAKAS